MNGVKYMACMVFLAAAAALGSKVGDTYQQVIAEKGNPKSKIEAGSLQILNYTDATIKLRDGVVVSVSTIANAQRQPSAPTPMLSPADQLEATKRELFDAVERVKYIVNQPAPMGLRTPQMKVWEYDYWFHPGSTKPDFDKVDVRKTQQMDYDNEDFVCLKERPNFVWAGRDLEFNAMTKYFYEDRSIPKKKLTEPEMLEINRLYRIIGRCEKELSKSGIRLPPST